MASLVGPSVLLARLRLFHPSRTGGSAEDPVVAGASLGASLICPQVL